MRSRIVTAAVVAMLTAVSSCSLPGVPEGEHEDVVKPAAPTSLQKKAPTLTLDAQAKLADPTTLQLLEERSQELAKSKKRSEDLEAQLRQRAQDLERVKDDAKARRQEKEQLEGLLKDATENERAATEKALSAEIARLKFEQELLRMKLGNMMREKP